MAACLALILAFLSGRAALAQVAETSGPGGASSPALAGDQQTRAQANAWERALDALVTGDLVTARSALEVVVRDPSVDERRRAEASDLIARIDRRRAHAPATTPAPDAAEAAAARPPSTAADDDRGGRTFLVGTTTLGGLALWGWTLPTALDVQNDRAFIGLYMVTAGAAFGGPFLLTRQGPVTWGMSNMTWLGTTRGAAAGIAASLLASGTDDPSDRNLAASALVGSVVGATAATLWARQTGMNPGTAHATGIGGDVGALTGLALAHLTGLDQRDRPDAERDSELGTRMSTGFGLAGGAVGLLGGRVLASRRDFTWADAEVMRLPIAIGVNAAAMVMDWSGTDSTRAIVSVLALGGLAGGVLGDRLVKNKDYSVGQGFLLDLGTVAGALATTGVVYLVSGSSESETFLTSSFVGAAAAFSALYLTLDAPMSRRLAAKLTPADDSAPRVSVVPYVGPHSARGLALAGSF